MPNVFRGNGTGWTHSDLSGRRVFKGRVPSAFWWDPNNVGLSCVGAYRAINSIGTPWADGPANYAASLVNNVTPGVNDLIEGNGAVPWAAATGWGFVAASVQYFDTGLTPASDQSWSVFVQYANFAAIDGILVGMRTAGGSRSLRIRPNETLLNRIQYCNGDCISVAPALANGNLGIAGSAAYRDGVGEGGAIGIWTDVAAHSISIGALNNSGVMALFATADIYAVAIYDAGPAAVQAEALAIATAMAAL